MYFFRFYIRVVLISFLLFPTFSSIAQNSMLDSLKAELKKANDTIKINLLNTIGLECSEINYDTAIGYLKQAQALAEKIDFKKGLINSYSYMGYVYYYYGHYEKALDVYLQEEKEYQLIGAHQLMPDYNNIAVCYFFLENYQKALDYYIKDLKKQENKGNKMNMLAPLNGIGNIYFKMQQYNNAFVYYGKALALSNELKNNYQISLVLKNIGNVYQQLNNNDTALIYYQKTLAINEELADSIGMAVTLMNIGEVYRTQKNYEKSIHYCGKALEIHEKLRNEIEIARTLHNLGVLEYENNNYEKGIELLKKSLNIADSIENKDLTILGNQALAEAYYKKGDYKSAYEHYKIHSAVKDSVFNESSTKAIAEMQTKYETDKKEQQIELLTKDKRNQETLRNALIVGVLLLLIVAALAYNRYRIKQKANIEIAQKNKEINESISYAKRIQTSFLTSEKYIAKHLSDYFILYAPRNVVSGDFYWLMEKNNNLYVCTADCTGHGIPGAFMSLISMGILNEIIYSKTHISHTDDILNELRRIIILAVNPEGSSEEARDGMDAVLARFDFQKMEMEYSAANSSFYVIRNGELLIFKPDKMPVGKHIGTEKPFTRNLISIQKGDCIYTFSDGFADQFGGVDDKKFQTKRLKKMFMDNYQKPMNVQKEIYAQTLKEWQGTNEQVDDILVMGVRV